MQTMQKSDAEPAPRPQALIERIAVLVPVVDVTIVGTTQSTSGPVVPVAADRRTPGKTKETQADDLVSVSVGRTMSICPYPTQGGFRHRQQRQLPPIEQAFSCFRPCLATVALVCVHTLFASYVRDCLRSPPGTIPHEKKVVRTSPSVSPCTHTVVHCDFVVQHDCRCNAFCSTENIFHRPLMSL
jgi:hypothetical protein